MIRSNHTLAAVSLAFLLAQPAAAQDHLPTDIHVVALEHVAAEDLRATLVGLLEGSEGERAQVRAHPATNSLLVSAGDARWNEIQRLIAKLDVPVEGQRVPDAAAGRRIELTLGDDGQLSVAELAKLLQRLTGRIYTFRADDVGERTVPVGGTLRIDRAHLDALFEFLLRTGGMQLVTHRDGDVEMTEIVVARADETPQENAGVTRIIVQLEHLDARRAVTDLRPFVAPGTTIGAIGQSRAVLLQGPPLAVKELVRVLELVDNAARVPTATRFIRLEHVAAGPVATKLFQLFGPRGPAPAGHTHDAATFRAVDTGPKTLVVTGHEDTVSAVLDVIAQLDVEER